MTFLLESRATGAVRYMFFWVGMRCDLDEWAKALMVSTKASRRVIRPASAACSSISSSPKGLLPMISVTMLSMNEFGPQPKFVSARPYSSGSCAVIAAPAICLLSYNQ